MEPNRHPSWALSPPSLAQGRAQPVVSSRCSHCHQDSSESLRVWITVLVAPGPPTPICQMRKMRQDKHHWPSEILTPEAGSAGLPGLGHVRGVGGGWRLHLSWLFIALIWLVFVFCCWVVLFCFRFFFPFFFKPQTHTTFIIKTQNQKPPSSSFQLGVGGCWSEPSSAT